MEELFGQLRAAGWNPRMMDRSVVHYDKIRKKPEVQELPAFFIAFSSFLREINVQSSAPR